MDYRREIVSGKFIDRENEMIDADDFGCDHNAQTGYRGLLIRDVCTYTKKNEIFDTHLGHTHSTNNNSRTFQLAVKLCVLKFMSKFSFFSPSVIKVS